MIAENTILFNKNKPRENYIKKELWSVGFQMLKRWKIKRNNEREDN